MVSFEPVVVLYGSSKIISSIRLRTPVTFIVATDEILLEELITTDPGLSETCLQRYFVVLFESISDNIIERLQSNHRVRVIYSREKLACQSTTSSKKHRIIHKHLQQFTLILTADIVHFLTAEGEKQAKLERLHLTRIYYRQARLLKEWAMSFAKAEPCHILVIPLNTSENNLIKAVERIEHLTHQLGYTSVVIRTLNDYIPSLEDNRQALLPYAQTLFEHEHPPYVRDLIRRLSPLRLYLYGNEEVISSEWSKLLITREVNVMDDEDNWCAFIENEEINNEIKWNIGAMFGDKWQIKRLTPINLTDLNKNLRFQSALRRAFKTFDRRQLEITAEIFDWYDKCVLDGHLRLEPKLTVEQENKVQIKQLVAHTAYSQCRITNPSSFSYFPNFECQGGPSFIWLDEILNKTNDYLNDVIKPFQWNFFSNIFQCLSFIENQIRDRKEIFLVLSGSLGCRLFLTENHILSTIRFVYIYCSRLAFHEYWIQYYAQIQGAFNDLTLLGEKIEENLKKISPIEADSITNRTTSDDANFDLTLISVPITVFDRDQAQAFMSHQRAIDTLLCTPFTSEARTEMIDEFRRIYQDDRLNLSDVENFEDNYHSNNALQWYTRDTFLYRMINRALRSSDVEMMFKMRYFLTDLYVQLQSLCTPNQTNRYADYYTVREKVYRGQRLFRKEFQHFQELIGQIISINTFLSTTKSLQVALTFAIQIDEIEDMVPIVFCIAIDSSIQNKRPYGNISNFSAYHDEEEVLFSMGSIFRIQSIENLDKYEHIPIIYLSLIDQTDIYDVNRI